MVFFKLFKKKESREEKELTLEEAQKAIGQECNALSSQEKNIYAIIHKKLDTLLESLKEKNNHLKTINIDEIKEREKIKAIVKINLHNYITYVDRLIKKLQNLDASENLIEAINTTFSDFKKKSHVSYEKATYLIGVEMGQIKDAIKQFFNELDLLLKENEILLKKVTLLRESQKIIQNYLNETESITNHQKIRENITKKISHKKEKIHTLQNKKEETRSSKEYQENENNKIKKESEYREIKSELLKLKQLIDFKELVTINHSSKKDMDVIHEYQEQFIETFFEKRIDSLKPLLVSAKQYTNEFEKKLEHITKKQNDHDTIIIKTNWFEDEEKEIIKLEHEVNVLEKQKSTILKQIETIEDQSLHLKHEIQEKAKGLGYTVLI